MRGKRRRLWSSVHFLDLGMKNTGLTIICSMLGASFIKLVLECKENISVLTEKRLRANTSIKIQDDFKVDRIEELDIKQQECKKIEFQLGNTADSINFDYSNDCIHFLNDRIYNSILNAIKEMKDDIKKFLKLREKYIKEMKSHINEPYLGMLGLE